MLAVVANKTKVHKLDKKKVKNVEKEKSKVMERAKVLETRFKSRVTDVESKQVKRDEKPW